MSGAAMSAIICPATSSMTTKPGSLRPLSRATVVDGGIPSTVITIETRIAVGSSQLGAISRAAAHHTRIVIAEAHVPDPGCRWPMPKKVAIIHEKRDLPTVGAVVDIGFRIRDQRERVMRVRGFRLPVRNVERSRPRLRNLVALSMVL